jgi:hypothetical protein
MCIEESGSVRVLGTEKEEDEAEEDSDAPAASSAPCND